MSERELFSISRVNTYLENPWKHWCKYIAKYKPKKNPEADKYMDRGTVFHRCVELIAQGSSPNEAEAISIMEAHEKEFVEEARVSGTLAFQRYLKENPTLEQDFTNIIHTEYELRYPLSDTAEFIGFIDAIIDNGDGTVTLVDYKTYSNAPQENKLRYSLQANMYIKVAQLLGFKVGSFRYDCINPKLKLVGRAYRFKRIEFKVNQNVADVMFEEFKALVETIQQFPQNNMYVVGDYMPDIYDLLYKVYVGDVNEDLDTFIKENFKEFPDD